MMLTCALLANPCAADASAMQARCKAGMLVRVNAGLRGAGRFGKLGTARRC